MHLIDTLKLLLCCQLKQRTRTQSSWTLFAGIYGHTSAKSQNIDRQPTVFASAAAALFVLQIYPIPQLSRCKDILCQKQ